VSYSSVFATTFLAACVEVIEMVIIVVGVGSVRGWRSTWLGAGAGLAVLAVLVLVLGTALTAVPIGGLRLVVGSLLLVFGLQWLRKGVIRVSTNGFRGMGDRTVSPAAATGRGVDWTAFVLAFKGVLLEGLEVAFIVVSFGVTARALRPPSLARPRPSWSSRARACFPAGSCSGSPAVPCSCWWERCSAASGRSGPCRDSGSGGLPATLRSWSWSAGMRWRLPATSGSCVDMCTDSCPRR
jgi:hypothetical protein